MKLEKGKNFRWKMKKKKMKMWKGKINFKKQKKFENFRWNEKWR